MAPCGPRSLPAVFLFDGSLVYTITDPRSTHAVFPNEVERAVAIACLDASYPDRGAFAACVVLADWTSCTADSEHVRRVPHVEPYIPGQLYRRELPCLLAVLEQLEAPLSTLVIDGYVWLDVDGRAGLGAYLHRAMAEQVAVVGVAKTRFGPAPRSAALEVLRGASRRPLLVTAAGMDALEAARLVERMSGAARIPWALRRVDRLCRAGAVVPEKLRARGRIETNRRADDPSA